MQFPSTTASTHQLENGLTVILDSDRSAPVISAQAWVATGSMHEGDFLGAGLSHLLEHMVFKGTENYSGKEIADMVQAAGGEWNAYTTFDRTVYYIDGPADSAQTFLKVLTEMVFKPSFPAHEYEKEKDVIRREIDMGLDDPDDRNSQLLYSTAYAYDPRRHPIIGHMELFDQITHEQMVEYHRQRYTTENTFLSISGDFEVSEMIYFLDDICSSIPRSFTQPVSPAIEPPQMGTREMHDTFAIPASKLTMAWQVPGLEHPDAPALELLSTILGSGRSSRLYQHIREQQGLCHHIAGWSSISPGVTGLFAVSAIVDYPQRGALQQAVLEEIAKLSNSDFFEELKKANRMTLVSQFRTLTTASGRASDLASNWHDTRNLDFTRDFLDLTSRVTPDDLQRVARTYLIPQNLTITSLDPEDAAEADQGQDLSVQRGAMETRVLSNGLTLVMQRDARLPTVSTTLATLTGLPSETVEKSGINTLLASLMTKGTISRTAEEIAVTMDSMGASFGVSCGNNTTLTSASCLQPDLPITLEILADIALNPVLPPDSIDRERGAQIAAIQEQAEDPLSVAFKTLRPSLFGAKSYGLNSIGTEESLTSLKREDLVAHHQQYFTAKNSVLAIFGDIDPDRCAEMAESLFANMPVGERVQTPAQELPEPSTHELHLDKQQAVLTVGFRGASAADEDNYALELIHDYCTDMAGPLFTKIREDMGLAYYVSATQFHGINTGMFAFYLGTSPDQLETARAILLDEIKTIAEHGIPEDTLESVKTTWLASHALSNQKLGSLARLSAIDTLLGFPADHHLKAPEEIKSLSSDQIRAAAQKYLGSHEPVIVTVTP
ncbi:insulinase family protein [Verrucomicrobiaceae bacterium 5K15]|uniref:Insulinase family protein n=1 Tax=Oceaniferula flava TaxID=2800421 RepID=A0AAE2SA37_9BACT|nr:pitrilysin family protein [Oceaniferula flavus]MBK1853567.1 insulinase family protein [Oceaniferula flavus]MBM1134872.1 insulinase family protein [Oceaniferula flavus]